jgi:hypothetical protein
MSSLVKSSIRAYYLETVSPACNVINTVLKCVDIDVEDYLSECVKIGRDGLFLDNYADKNKAVYIPPCKIERIEVKKDKF